MKFIRNFLFILMVLTFCSTKAESVKVKTITSEATIFSSFYESEISAKERAIQQAQLEGLRMHFGLVIQEINEIEDREGGPRAHSLSVSDVKGEWIEDIDEPEVNKHPTENGYYYTAKVKFRGRELKHEYIDLDIRLLDGTDKDKDRIHANTYNHGDNFYVYFCSPIDGYLTIYLRDDDEKQTMQAILPYEGQGGEAYPIKADTPYIFFSKNDAEPEIARFASRLKMYARKSIDHNIAYIIFSPNSFSRSATHENKSRECTMTAGTKEINLMPRETTAKDYRKWVSKQMRTDSRLQVKEIPLQIHKDR